MRPIVQLLLFCLPFISAAQNKLVPQTGHNGQFCMLLSPDDQKLLTAGLDGRMMLWDITATKAVHNIKIPGPGIYCAAWKSDGTLFAIGTADSLLIFFDAQTAKEIKRMKTPFAPVEMCFNPKHDVLAVGGNNGAIKVLDFKNGDVFFSFRPDNYVSGIAFSSNGALLFTAGWNKGIVAYEMNQGKVMMTLPTTAEHFTAGISLSQNNEILFMHMSDGTTEVVDLFQNKTTGSFSNPAWYTDDVTTIYLEPAITGDNTFIVTANRENSLVISNRKNNITQTYHNTFGKTNISAIVPSHNGKFFMLADAAGRISCVYLDERLFENESPLLWRRLQSNPERIYRVDFLERDETLALTGNGHYRFNMVTGDLHRRDQDSAMVNDRVYTTRYFVTDKKPGVYYSTDLLRHTGYEINGDKQWPLSHFAFSKDTTVVALQNSVQEMLIYDLKNRKTVFTMDASKEKGFRLFNGTLNDLFIFSQNNTLNFVNTKGETVKTIEPSGPAEIVNICADAGMNRVYLLDNNNRMACYAFKTGREMPLNGELAQDRTVYMMELSPDGKTMGLYEKNAIRFYHVADGKSFFEISTNGETARAFTFNQKGNHAAVAMENGITQVWDLDRKQKLVNILATPQDGMLVYTDEHYYMATKEAARQMVFTQGNQPVSMANAELSYNRPDKVLEKIGLSDPRLINAYRFAYERRLKRSKANVSEDFDVPFVTLLNQHELKTSTDRDRLLLKIKAGDGKTKLASLQVWINNVPVFGQQGIGLDGKSSVEKEVGLDLVSGTNRIKFSVINEKGTESEKQEITVVNTRTVRPDLYLLTVGTSRYKNAAFNLTYAAKDANDLAALFGSIEKNGEKPYGNIFTRTLVNEEVTAAHLRETKAFLQQAKRNDVVMIFVAGHGVRNEEMKYFFGTHDMDFEKPGEKGFSEEDFAQLVDGLKAIKRLVFFDTCLSGELDRDEAEQTLATIDTKNGNVTFRTAGAGIRTKTSGINNASALMREIYNDLDEGTGSTVISSAGGAEFAMESSEWKNGLFTYCFLNGLKNFAADQNSDRQITVSEIQDYVRKEVVKLSSGKQQPAFKNENLIMNYRIW